MNRDTNLKSFDSILVRLKVKSGAISACRVSLFRFHTGSIKRNMLNANIKQLKRSFDSILVRLKERVHRHITTHLS